LSQSIDIPCPLKPAANPPHAAAAGEWDRQTEGLTDRSIARCPPISGGITVNLAFVIRAELQSSTQRPQRRGVHAGDSLTLECRRGSSVPPPVILWYRTTVSSRTGNRPRDRVRPGERVAVGVDGKLPRSVLS